jgi:hypothetical protein
MQLYCKDCFGARTPVYLGSLVDPVSNTGEVNLVTLVLWYSGIYLTVPVLDAAFEVNFFNSSLLKQT